MEEVLSSSVHYSDGHKKAVSGAQLPLAMLSEGETSHVVRVRGTQDMKRHLAELGFVDGAEVTVISRVAGDVIVSVKGSSFGLDRNMAMKVVTA